MLANKELQLFNRIKTGDQQAFETVFNIYYSPLCNFALGFVKDLHCAEDIVIEAFQRFWDNRSRWTIQQSTRNYLFTIVRNDCLRFMKKENFNGFLSYSEVNDFSFNPDAGEMEWKELESAFQQAFDLLPAGCRQVFSLHRIEGFSYREISGLLQVSVKTVENQMSKAIRMIVGRLESKNIL